MTAEQTPDIEAVLAAVVADLDIEMWRVVSEHDPSCPGDEKFCVLHCPVQMQVRVGPDELAQALAPVLAAAVREARAAELREAADVYRALDDGLPICAGHVTAELDFRADRIAVDAPEGGA